MARNIEIKASIDNVSHCMDIAKSLSGSEPELIMQEDHFFNCKNGRLKLRIFTPERGELIFYKRPDDRGPKTSEYFITKTDEPDILLSVLEKSYGIRGIVKKSRNLFLIGRSRVHIDRVENLGDFLEFEVVLSGEDDTGTGRREARYLLTRFEIEEERLINCSYIDLIDQRAR